LTLDVALYPAYLRGEAYLTARQGPAAAAEFQKIINQPGIVLNEPIGALARLGLGRAYALEAGVPLAAVDASARWNRRKQDDTLRTPLEQDALTKARAAYEAFFALWKDADPDVPILKRAKAEYAKLN
jgi:eukaryotic-like serine/threonine-protein kinase